MREPFKLYKNFDNPYFYMNSESLSFWVFGNTGVSACVPHSWPSNFKLTYAQSPAHFVFGVVDNFNFF